MEDDPIDALFSQFEASKKKREADACVIQGNASKRASSVKTVESLASDNAEPNHTYLNGYQDVLIEIYESDTNCLHECVRPLPVKTDSKTLYPNAVRPPARDFPYTLDKFQATAIRCLEEGESVLVSAHTSAGKTTVAEYAIAMSIRDKQRVIYTSPIKALSNQKYRNLSNTYGNDVGLLTGDVSLNPSASVMVMTTEILRSMLYRGSEMIREMKWVIFDEIHYMRDRERGVVWEETIILLPDTVRLVFLSATIPNAREFIEWICRIKHQPCHAIYTDYRPVPLQHYLYPLGSEGVHLVMDEKKEFREDQFYKAVAELKKNNDPSGVGSKLKKNTKNVSDIERIILMCHERSYTPLIVFSFSKREVEANALKLKSISLTTGEEQELIETVFNNAMDTLGEDRFLPQITCMLPLLKRGIGLHHGGLLPIVKEVIEILFQESLVKVLFSTETFSMGVNMPAKTVVFTKLRKWDGTSFRMISPGEYIQMSGRAGRRGLDTRGLSIIMLDEQLEADVAQQLFMGEPLSISSQFHLGYNMVLNLLRVEGANPEYMIRLSFYQFQQDKSMLQLEEKKKQLEQELEAEEPLDAPLDGEVLNDIPEDMDVQLAVPEYYALEHAVKKYTKKLRDLVMLPKYVLRFLQVGRVVRVSSISGEDMGYGIVIQQAQKKNSAYMHHKFDESLKKNFSKDQGEETEFFVSVVLQSKNKGNENEPLWEAMPCTLEMLQEVTQVVANVPSSIDSTHEHCNAVGIILTKIAKQLCNSFLPLDPIKHMKIDSSTLGDIQFELKEKIKELQHHPLHTNKHLPLLLARFTHRLNLSTEKKRLEETIDSQKHLVMKDDLRAMRCVLRTLDYLDDQNLITLKGRAACEVSSVDELVMCELLFQNVFHNVETSYLVALLSCFVFDEKADDVLPTDPKLLQLYERIREVARRVAEVSLNAKLPINVNEYVDKFKGVLMQIVLKWMSGAKFGDLDIPQDIFEGSVVRVIRRLEELLRQLMAAAKSIGEQELESRLSDAVKRMRRGIVFSPSLYL